MSCIALHQADPICWPQLTPAQMDARGLPFEDISARHKSLYSVWVKMQAGGIKDLDQVSQKPNSISPAVELRERQPGWT